MKNLFATMVAATALAASLPATVVGDDIGELAITGAWSLEIDGSAVPILGSLDSFDVKLSQQQVWDRFGTPDEFALNQFDLYIQPDGYIYLVYYGRGGETLAVIRLPQSSY